MSSLIRLLLLPAALAALPAAAADVTGEWTATFVTALGQRHYTYVFRQDGADLIGTASSQDGVFPIANGAINRNAIEFIENVTVQGRRVVFEYTGEVVSATEIRFKRQAAGRTGPVLQFVATRSAAP